MGRKATKQRNKQPISGYCDLVFNEEPKKFMNNLIFDPLIFGEISVFCIDQGANILTISYNGTLPYPHIDLHIGKYMTKSMK